MFTPHLHVSYSFTVYKKYSIDHRYANATFNQPCIIENTTYITDLHFGDPNGDGEATYTTSVIKHNCRSPNLFFCDPDADIAGPTCQPTKELKKNCRFDAECASVRWFYIIYCLID
jgi:hypothetical protein